MNIFNYDLQNFFYFKKKFLIRIFKTSVSYKKFFVKQTKFKRKTIMRWKHKSQWLMYTHLLKLWTIDYMFNRQYLKFQFYNKIFINNFFFFNFDKIKNEMFNCNFLFFSLTKTTFFYFNKNLYKNIKNNNIVFGLYKKNLINSNNNSITPIYSAWDTNFFLSHIESNKQTFDLDIIFSLTFDIILQKLLEFKKILILLYLLNLKR